MIVQSLRCGQGTGWPYSSVAWNAVHLFLVELGITFKEVEPLEAAPGWPDYEPIFDRPIDAGTDIDDMFDALDQHPEDASCLLCSLEGVSVEHTNELVPNP